MSDTKESTENPEQVEGQEAAPPPKSNKMLFIIVGVVVLIIIIAGVIFFTPIGKKLRGVEDHEGAAKAESKEEKKEEHKDIVFVQIPSLVINLRTDGKQAHMLKIEIAVELADSKEKEAVENLRPRIIDQMQGFLRELEFEEVKSVGGMEHVRQELFPRISNAIAPFKIKSILIRDFIPY